MRNILRGLCPPLFLIFMAQAPANSIRPSWTETLYTVTVTSGQIEYILGFTSHETKNYTWSYGYGNHRVVTTSGTDTEEPSWRSDFTPKETNYWMEFSPTFNVVVPDGKAIYAKATYQTTTGTNTFTQGASTATRSLDKKISTNLSYEIRDGGDS